MRCNVTERQLGLGAGSGSSFGPEGVRKRLGTLASLAPLSGSRLLDIGCANGTYTLTLAPAFDRVDAVDIEPERLDELRAAITRDQLEDRVEVHQMSGDALDFPDGTFDVVTTIEVLEHVSDLDRTIAETHRVLRGGGRFCITTPNRWFPFETHGVLINGRRRSPLLAPFVTWFRPLHRRVADARTFTRRELLGHLERQGFEITGATYIMPPFDRARLGSLLRRVTAWMERSPLRVLGMAHVVVATKR